MLYKSIISFIFACVSSLFITLAQAADQPAVKQDANMPNAKQHQVKAPDIDFERLRDPFASYLAAVAMRGQRLLQAQQSMLSNRQREPLEVFDLSTLTLVATLKMGDKQVAMIQDSQGKGYTVRQGNYMGKNNGRIEKIDSDGVYLVEKVVNSQGAIVNRQVTLTIKEVNE